MKHKLKNYLKLGILLFGISITLTNCEKEDEFNPEELIEENKSNYKISHKSYATLSAQSKFSNAITKLVPNKNSLMNNRTVMENQYGFTIIENMVTEIVVDDYVSYTILIERPEPNSTYFENLVLEVFENNTVKAYIVKYTPTEITEVTAHNSFNFQGNVEATPINYDNTLARWELECSTVWVSYCHNDGTGNVGGSHVAGANCTTANLMWDTPVTSCSSVWYDDATQTQITTTTTTSGSPKGGSNLHTTPLLPEFEEVDDPCEKLKELLETDKQNIKPDIQFLKDKLTAGVKKEWGVNLNRTKNPDDTHTYTNTQVEGSTNGLDHTKGWNWIGGAHIHTTSGYSMYSWKDIHIHQGFNELASSDNQSHVTTILVCNNPAYDTDPTINQYNVYALSTEDYTALNTQINNTLNSPLYSGLTYKQKLKEIHRKQKKDLKANQADLEKYFLKAFRKYGISLYKASDDMSNWNKLTLPPVKNGTQVVVKTPCN